MKLATREQGPRQPAPPGPPAAPVVLLHGLFGRARNLARVQHVLAETRRVVALDLRNHGASPHQPGMDYATLAADVAETLEAIDLPPPVVLGHSMGGKVAMRLALHTPSRVRALIVADIAPVAYHGDYASYAEAMRRLALQPGLTRGAIDAQLAASIPDPGIRGLLLQNLIMDGHPRWQIGLAEITAGLPDVLAWPPTQAHYDGPTRFVAGARSDYLRPDHHALIRATFPNAEFTTLAQAGHWLHVDNEAGFVAVVQDFLDQRGD